VDEDELPSLRALFDPVSAVGRGALRDRRRAFDGGGLSARGGGLPDRKSEDRDPKIVKMSSSPPSSASRTNFAHTAPHIMRDMVHRRSRTYRDCQARESGPSPQRRRCDDDREAA